VWSVKEDPTSGGDVYRAGSLNSLVVRLTNSNFNSDLLGAFVAGYELFSSSSEVNILPLFVTFFLIDDLPFPFTYVVSLSLLAVPEA